MKRKQIREYAFHLLPNRIQDRLINEALNHGFWESTATLNPKAYHDHMLALETKRKSRRANISFWMSWVMTFVAAVGLLEIFG